MRATSAILRSSKRSVVRPQIGNVRGDDGMRGKVSIYNNIVRG